MVSEFEDEADVLARANDTQYGLNAAVFSQDINRALRVASKLQSGTVCVNCSTQSSFDVPFGGTKQSGWGREGGKVRAGFQNTLQSSWGATDSCADNTWPSMGFLHTPNQSRRSSSKLILFT